MNIGKQARALATEIAEGIKPALGEGTTVVVPVVVVISGVVQVRPEVELESEQKPRTEFDHGR